MNPLDWRNIVKQISTEQDFQTVSELAEALIRALDEETRVRLENFNKSEEPTHTESA
jgi:hypothetical protein